MFEYACGFGLTFLLASCSAITAHACPKELQSKRGDTLFSIAQSELGDTSYWPLILEANPRLSDPNLAQIELGLALSITCRDDPIAAEPAPVLKLLTSANYAPFATKDRQNVGLILDIVNAALEMSLVQSAYKITWDNDWQSHLELLVEGRSFDLSFPWPRPDCAPGRRWISDLKITLVVGEDLEDCFNRVLLGTVDAVVVNQIKGAQHILDMGLRSKVVRLDDLTSMEDLRVVVPGNHPNGAEYLTQLNAGLQMLKESGRYEDLVAHYADAFSRRLETST